MKFPLKNKSSFLKAALFVFIFSLFISRALFTKELFRTDDLELHGARLANYYLALKQDQIPPYWAPNLNYGFGYPVFMFSYHFPYLASIPSYALGASIETSLNITMIFLIVFGGLGVFLFSYLKNKNILLAVTSSLVYQSAPYILLNIFVRGAIGEIAFLSFLPWVFVMIKTRDKAGELWHIFTSIFIFFGLILSHPISLMLASPIILGYLFIDGFFHELFSWKRNKRSVFFFISALIALGITSFFWLPFLMEKQYIAIENHHIITNFSNRYLLIKQLLFSKWGYGGADLNNPVDSFPATTGLSILFILLLSFKKLFKNKWKNSKNKKLYFWLSIFFTSVFLMLPMSENIWSFSKVLPFLQYPWRLFWVTTFSGVMILNNIKVGKLSLIILMAISFHHAIFYAKPLSYISNSNHDWLEYYGTSTSDNELKPIWFDEHKNIGITDIVSLDQCTDDKKLKILSWTGTKMNYELEVGQGARVFQKTMYFPGWEAFVNGKQVEIDYQDEEVPGRVVFPVKKGKNSIEVMFTNNTPARKAGIYLTEFSIFAFLILFFWKIFFKNQR